MSVVEGTAIHPSVRLHPAALCESSEVGERTRIWAFAHVLPGAVIGADCNLCDHTYVEAGARVGDRVTVKNGVALWQGVTIEDEVFLGPNAAFTNDLRPRAAIHRGPEQLLPTLVKTGATIGANATIVCGVVVGAYAMVAAGAVVTRDVPDHGLVVGSPARPVGWVCLCGDRLDPELVCRSCGRAYRQAGGGGPGLETRPPG